ncbi:glycosyltransferase [Promicromonospora sp. NPDC060271]|uniref:glycosyltransferase n=1 Tax=Promicromonospora sp. NPDC060271 TaxID=3347089 RepID=UPI00364A0918
MAERREFGDGPMGRAANAIYWYLVVELLLVLTSLPGLVALALLDRSPGNVPFVVLCLLPLGPAASAGLFALRARATADALAPASSFWRGYRLNWADVLRVWTPALVVLGVLGFSLANLGASGVPTWYAPVLLVIGAGLLLWTVNVLVIVSFFGFRARDSARLAAHYLAARPLVTLGNLSLLVLAGGVIVLTTEALFGLVAVVWLAFVLRNARPLLADVEERFTGGS